MYREELSPSLTLEVSEVFSACRSSTSLRWPSWVWALSKNVRWCATMLSPSDRWPTSPSLTITGSSMELWPRSSWVTSSRGSRIGTSRQCENRCQVSGARGQGLGTRDWVLGQFRTAAGPVLSTDDGPRTTDHVQRTVTVECELPLDHGRLAVDCQLSTVDSLQAGCWAGDQ